MIVLEKYIEGLRIRAAKIIHIKYSKLFYFHSANHKLNMCIGHYCKLTSVSYMISAITSVAHFFNFSSTLQKPFELHVNENDASIKKQFFFSCQTHWIETINSLSSCNT